MSEWTTKECTKGSVSPAFSSITLLSSAVAFAIIVAATLVTGVAVVFDMFSPGAAVVGVAAVLVTRTWEVGGGGGAAFMG